jgi:hypothetical protein
VKEVDVHLTGAVFEATTRTRLSRRPSSWKRNRSEGPLGKKAKHADSATTTTPEANTQHPLLAKVLLDPRLLRSK